MGHAHFRGGGARPRHPAAADIVLNSEAGPAQGRA